MSKTAYFKQLKPYYDTAVTLMAGKIARDGLTYCGVERLTGIPHSTAHRRIKEPGGFTLDEFGRLASALGWNVSITLVEK